MVACPSCGRESPSEARFCAECGAALDTFPAARKTVTVLFSDVVGSTTLGERLDPEAMRLAMSRYFEAMRATIERHGGIVEKFAGDAVMAVFGIPQLHEDDALRAVRTAVEMREAGERVNDELEPELRVRIASRTGVNTGEVVTGAGQTFATGDAVNVAARLEQAAPVGEILLGAETYAAVRDTVRAEPVGDLALRGKSTRVDAWRLVELVEEVPAFMRTIHAPFVGRSDELARLQQALERSVSTRRCELATILGAPGIGKSRLARELVHRATQHRVVVGRCLSYGEGITFWPLAEIVRQLPPLEEILAGTHEAELIAARVRGAIGMAGTGAPAAETSWAFRRLFEAVAHERPLLIVVDDIHWAEPMLLDLLEYVVSFVGDAPILLVCLARPDLLDEHPTWITPRSNATVVTVEALRADESERLVERLAGGLAEETRARVVEAAGGNPLFVEQLVAHQAESGHGELHVPATIQALLAARIDRLAPDERAVLERASIEGRMFHRGAVTELLPERERAAVGSRLIALLRKEFIRPDKSLFPADDGFRFGHILIRDAAYDGMAKQLRAELHARYAEWLEAQAADRVGEYEEFLGYHLEQAHRYHAELGRAGPRQAGLAGRAAAFLASSGRRVLGVGDAAAAAKLLARAEALLPEDDSERPGVLTELGKALDAYGHRDRSAETFGRAADLAASRDDHASEARARLLQASSRFSIAPSKETLAELRLKAERAIPILQAAGNSAGLAEAWSLIGFVNHLELRMGEAEEALSRALEIAESSDDRSAMRRARLPLVEGLAEGPTPISEAIRRSEQMLESLPDNSFDAIQLLGELAALYAAQGRFDEARALVRRKLAGLEEFGRRLAMRACERLAEVDRLSGDLHAAEERLRGGLRIAEGIGSRYAQAGLLEPLSRVLYEQGRYDEALLATEGTEELASGSPGSLQLLWRAVRAMVLARNGRLVEAEELAREAVLGVGSESPGTAGELQMYLAEVLRLSGRPNEARAALEAALRQFERKEHLVLAARARAQLEELN